MLKYGRSKVKHMEKAGADETAKDAERRGLGTPATRADIIESLRMRYMIM